MKENKVYLKPNFVAEPLVAKWYAWSHLISPATACLNIKNRHIPILKSYIADPQSHIEACKDPKMTGGPFIDYKVSKVKEIKTLLGDTLKSQAKQLAFAMAFENLDKLLRDECTGFSLASTYSKVPEILKGYVELVYDLHNNPSFRVKESLLYNSECYNKKAQGLLLYQIFNDDRPFVFSTPRTDTENSIYLNIPFDHPGIDELFEMTRTPKSYEYIRQLLGIHPKDDRVFASFFTTQAPEPYNKYEGDFVRIRYFGHACILVETKDISILVDPVISYGYDTKVSRYTYADLPDQIDYVLITHNHQDHVLLETMLQLRSRVGYWVIPKNGSGNLPDPSLKLMLKHTGFKNVIELNDLDELDLPNGKIIALPFIGEHGDLDIASKLGYLVKLDNFRIMFLADSQNLEFKLYEHIQAACGDVDAIFLGMECNGAPVSWIYGPYYVNMLERGMDLSRSIAGCDFDKAIDIVNKFSPKEVYIYAMGMEPWVKFLSANIYTPECDAIVQSNLMIEECKKRQLITERLYGEKEILRSGVMVDNF